MIRCICVTQLTANCKDMKHFYKDRVFLGSSITCFIRFFKTECQTHLREVIEQDVCQSMMLFSVCANLIAVRSIFLDLLKYILMYL